MGWEGVGIRGVPGVRGSNVYVPYLLGAGVDFLRAGRLADRRTKNGSSQGQNLALTGLTVLSSLSSHKINLSILLKNQPPHNIVNFIF